MSLPVNNTNSILVSAPGSVPTPATGEVTYFFNTSDDNKLYYKDDGGVVHLATEAPDGIDACTCAILKEFNCTASEGLLTGVIDFDQYTQMMGMGIKVTTPAGTWTVEAANPVS